MLDNAIISDHINKGDLPANNGKLIKVINNEKQVIEEKIYIDTGLRAERCMAS